MRNFKKNKITFLIILKVKVILSFKKILMNYKININNFKMKLLLIKKNLLTWILIWVN